MIILLLDENGQVKSEKIYKDGIEKWTSWYENGKNFLDSKGIQVHNVGIDSKLEVFPKKDFKGLFI